MTPRPSDQSSVPAGLSRRHLVGGGAVAATLGATALRGAGGSAQTPAADGEVIYPPNYQGARKTGLTKLSDETKTLKVFVNGDVEIADWNDNEFTRWYEEQTNVHIEWLVAPAADPQASLTTTLASGDYPDVIMGFNAQLTATQLLLYGAQGVFIPLEEYIDSSSPRALEIFEAYPAARGLLTMPDGHIYSMPYVNDCYHCNNADRMWIYKPWLDQLGLDMPQTLDEFMAAMIAFRDTDLNGNGQDDEIPLMGDIPAGGTTRLTNFIINSFLYRGVNHLRVAADGTLEETLTDPQRREAYRWLNGLTQEGIITEDLFTYTNDQLRALGNAEEVVLGCTPSYYWGSFTNLTDFSLEARWRDYVPVPTLAGPGDVRSSVWNYYGAVTQGSYIVTSACTDPDLAVRWCDGFYDLESTLRSVHGVIGTDVVWATEGETAINGEQALWRQLISWSEIPGTNYWAQRNPNYRSSEFRLGESVDPENPTFEKALYEATRDAWFPYAEPQDSQPVPYALNQEQADESALIQTTIEQYLLEVEAQFILGQVDLDSGWDAYVETMNQMGLPRYVEINNEAYAASQQAS